MARRTRRRSSQEFEEGAVACPAEPGATHASVAGELDVTVGQARTRHREQLAEGSADAIAARKAEGAGPAQLREQNERPKEENEVMRMAERGNGRPCGRHWSGPDGRRFERARERLFRAMGCEDVTAKLMFIAAHAAEHAVRLLCAVLGVGRGWFHDWRRQAPLRAEREAGRDALVAEIREAFDGSQGRYGAPRIHAELEARGHAIDRKTVARLVKENGIRPRRGPSAVCRSAPTAAIPTASRRPCPIATSRRQGPTPSGWPTSPTSRRTRAGSTWRRRRTWPRWRSSAGPCPTA